MYSPRLYAYKDSTVLYTPTVHLFDSLLHTHTLLVQTHTADVSASWRVPTRLSSTIDGNVDFVHSQYSCILTSQLCQLNFCADLTAK